MVILALDLARVCGWACGEPGGVPLFGHVDFGGSCPGETGANIIAWTSRMLAEHRPELAVIEATYLPRAPKSKGGGIPANARTLKSLLGKGYLVEALCWLHSVEIREVTPSEISEFILGHKRPIRREQKKAATLAAIRERYGFDARTDDEGDALAVWLIAEATVAPGLAARRGVGPLFQKKTPDSLAGPSGVVVPPVVKGRQNVGRNSHREFR